MNIVIVGAVLAVAVFVFLPPVPTPMAAMAAPPAARSPAFFSLDILSALLVAPFVTSSILEFLTLGFMSKFFLIATALFAGLIVAGSCLGLLTTKSFPGLFGTVVSPSGVVLEALDVLGLAASALLQSLFFLRDCGVSPAAFILSLCFLINSANSALIPFVTFFALPAMALVLSNSRKFFFGTLLLQPRQNEGI